MDLIIFTRRSIGDGGEPPIVSLVSLMLMSETRLIALALTVNGGVAMIVERIAILNSIAVLP